LLGDGSTCRDQVDAAGGEAYYRNALQLAEQRGMRPLAAHCHFGLGKLYRRAGNLEAAKEHLATAIRLYRATGMTFWTEQADSEFLSR
jgi:hypothetical protein